MRCLVLALLMASAASPAQVRLVLAGDDAVPMTTAQIAYAQTRWMYAQIGVTLRWQHSGFAGPAIHVRYLQSTPADVHPGALAYANPFSPDPEIVVFWDRIRHLTERRGGYEPRLLAHVLAHEIGHILNRTNAHSEAGVMKAHWTAADHDWMARRPLPFSEPDRRSIVEGAASDYFGIPGSGARTGVVLPHP